MLDFAPLPNSDPRFARRDNAAPQVDLYPFGRELNGRVETGHFEADEHWESEIAYKLELLERDTSLRRVIVEDDLSGLTDALWRVGDLLAADEPTLWRPFDGGVDLRGGSGGLVGSRGLGGWPLPTGAVK